jgi:hypothetical protein
MSHDWGLSKERDHEQAADTPEGRAKQAESWAAKKIAELDLRLQQQIDAKFNTGSVLKDIGRIVLLACICFGIAALVWEVLR